MPGCRIAVDPAADRGRLVDVEAHPVAGPVLEALGPAGLGDDLRGRRRRRRWPPTPGAHRGHPGRLGLGHHGEDPGQLPGRRRRRRRRCGSCPSGSRRRWPRSRRPPGRRRRCARPPGRAWGLAEFGARGHDGLEGPVLGAPGGAWRGRGRGRTRLARVAGPGVASSGSTSASAASAMAAARSIRAISPASLHHPERLDHAGVATSRRGASTLGPAPACAAQLTLSASRPTAAAAAGQPRPAASRWAATPPMHERRPPSAAPAPASCSAAWVR